MRAEFRETPRRLWAEGLLVFGAASVLIVGGSILERAGVVSAAVASTVTTGALIYVPLLWALFARLDLAELGATTEGSQKALVVLLWFSLATLPAFFLGNHLFEVLMHGHSFHWVAPAGFLSLVATEILVVAVPEEFFFRGYLQRRFEMASQKKWKLLGATLGAGWLVSSVLFAASHSLVSPALWHAGIIFPGLAFGWLRARTGSLIVPVLYHALCNVSMAVVQSCYHS